MNNVGLIGLGVMGQNLVLNMSEHNISVAVYNRTWDTTKKFCSENKGNHIEGYEKIEDFVNSLELPRKIIILVKAGDPVDEVIKEIVPYLSKNDILIDSGNSYFKDTERRFKDLKRDSIRFLGLGISGGEEGARNGASFMAGGDKSAYIDCENILKSCAASDFSGNKCVSYFGEGGAGHYVKMVHNGIEYIDMQLIADIYIILKKTNKDDEQISIFFEELSKGKSTSYLLDITARILKKKTDDNEFLINKILDYASQKGTGQWATQTAVEFGIPSFSFAESVFSRFLSAKKELRERLGAKYSFKTNCISIPSLILEKAYFCAKILSYAQGYELLSSGNKNFNWTISLSEISRIWQGGCIIRAQLLKEFEEIFMKNNDLNLLNDHNIINIISNDYSTLNQIASESILNNIYIPGILSAITYFNGYITASSSANLIAAQRDFFGAHGYKRNDSEGDFHTEWIN